MSVQEAARAPRVVVVNPRPIGERIVKFGEAQGPDPVIGYDAQANVKKTTPASTISAHITGHSRPTPAQRVLNPELPGILEQTGPPREEVSVVVENPVSDVEPSKGNFVEASA